MQVGYMKCRCDSWKLASFDSKYCQLSLVASLWHWASTSFVCSTFAAMPLIVRACQRYLSYRLDALPVAQPTASITEGNSKHQIQPPQTIRRSINKLPSKATSFCSCWTASMNKMTLLYSGVCWWIYWWSFYSRWLSNDSNPDTLRFTMPKESKLIDWVKVLHPTQHKLGHFGDVIHSQSLGTVLKKLNLTWQKHTYTNKL